MLETSNLHVSSQKCVALENIPFSTKALLILLISVAKIVPLLQTIV